MKQLLNISYKYHLSLALVVRFILIIYGEFHDQFSEVPYTDIDYKVFTDASRYILNSESPYNRHTYRYSPFLAIILMPNVILHRCFGKVLFSFVDILVGLLIRILVTYSRKNYVLCKEKIEKTNYLSIEENNDKPVEDDAQTVRKRKSVKNVSSDKETVKNDLPSETYDYVPDYCMLFWIYNPMSIIITTRGNCDSIAVFLVLLTLYYLQRNKNYFVAGLIHGLAIHFRLYPLLYSLSYFMSLSKFSRYDVDGRQHEIIFNENMIEDSKTMEVAECNKELMKNESVNKRQTIFKMKYLYYLIPNKDQLKLILGTLVSLVTLTYIFHYLYGYTFLYESYIYHLVRKDTRHNFSLFFYLQYLTAGVKNIGVWQKVLCLLPQVVLLIVLSVRYGLNRFTLNFSVLTQTIVMVTYNSVLTSQYFIWILGIMPLVLWQLHMTIAKGILWAIVWFIAQLAWLLPAYLLEFQGQNTFLFIWLQGVSFFCANMAVLGRVIKCFMFKVD